MAGKITELPAITSASMDDVLEIVDAPGTVPASKKITFDNLQKSITEVGGAVGIVAGGDFTIPSSNYLYIGDQSTNGSWRFYISGDNLVVEKRESGSWAEKGAFLA